MQNRVAQFMVTRKGEEEIEGRETETEIETMTRCPLKVLLSGSRDHFL